jgi:hypothetical protein
LYTLPFLGETKALVSEAAWLHGIVVLYALPPALNYYATV